MYLIVGLGNIGEKYQFTRHNIGFLVIDEITKNLSTSNINNSNFQSTLLKSAYTLFSKPTTYMNNSGLAVYAIKEYYKIDLENIIVIHDDIDLPFGTVKFKIGLRSLDAHISKEYIRVRIGIGKPANKDDVANYVLSNFSKEELNKLTDIITHTIKAIEALKTEEIDQVKSKFSLK